MYLTHLSLTNFRNFSRLDAEVPRGPILLVGGNAQGKTSLLEAIYFLATLVSFHTSSDRELINFLTSREPLAVARIVADYRREATPYASASDHHLEIRVIQEAVTDYNGTPRVRKEILLDGVKRRATEVIGAFNAVLFLPQMMRVVEGSPENRRRYLNLVMAQAVPQYALALSEYSKLLSQRNALLKQLYERGGDAEELSFWDQQLAAVGARIIYDRVQAIRQLEKLATRIHNELTRDQEVLRLDYQPAFDPLPRKPLQYALPLEAPLDRSGLSLESMQRSFLGALERLRREEIARGVTTIGPHRDELRFLGNGIDLGTYGSRGQGRTAMLSMKLAEVLWMKEKTGQWPVLLLDEVLAELDPERRVDLLARLSASEQSLLTTTDLDLFVPEFVADASIWQVRNGRIEDVQQGAESPF